MKKTKLTCPNCGTAIYLCHGDKEMDYFLKTEKVGHQCYSCKARVVINRKNVSYVDVPKY